MTVPSVREDLERDLVCLGFLGCVHGLNERNQMAFQLLQQAKRKFTVDNITDPLDCERSTAYRSISRLHEAVLTAAKVFERELAGE